MSHQSFSAYLRAVIIASVIAAVINLVVFLIGGTLQVDFLVQQPGVAGLQPVTLQQVVTFSIVPSIVAAVLLAILQRWTPSGMKVFESIAVIVLILSLLPLWLSPANLATTTTLSVMHLVAFAAIVGTFKQQLGSEPRPGAESSSAVESQS